MKDIVDISSIDSDIKSNGDIHASNVWGRNVHQQTTTNLATGLPVIGNNGDLVAEGKCLCREKFGSFLNAARTVITSTSHECALLGLSHLANDQDDGVIANLGYISCLQWISTNNDVFSAYKSFGCFSADWHWCAPMSLDMSRVFGKRSIYCTQTFYG